jgi:hypothetical protein
VSGQLHALAFLPWGKRAGTDWIRSWVDPTAGLDDVEKRKFLILPGLEVRPLGYSSCSQPLYRLRYHQIYLISQAVILWSQNSAVLRHSGSLEAEMEPQLSLVTRYFEDFERFWRLFFNSWVYRAFWPYPPLKSTQHFQWLRLASSKGPHTVNVSHPPNLRMETDPDSESLCYLE